jgi:hypothetical protein
VPVAKFGLWNYVESDEHITVAVTVDEGELTWQHMQVCAGVKNCDPRAIDPHTGQLLFSNSGSKQVLHVHITKDTGNFFDQHLSFFFEVSMKWNMS